MERRGDLNTGWGLALVALGLILLAGQVGGIDVGRYGWPLAIVAVGVVLLVMGLAGLDPTRSIVVPGAIVTTVGAILLYQNTTRHWESWAYAWALIPASIGLGVALRAALAGAPRQARSGLASASFFLVLFALGFAFFEGVLRISGRDFGAVGQYGFPVLLMLVGAWMLVGRVRLQAS